MCQGLGVCDMTACHGGVCEIRRPDILHSKTSVDFGPEFHLTTFRPSPRRQQKANVFKDIGSFYEIGRGQEAQARRKGAIEASCKTRLKLGRVDAGIAEYLAQQTRTDRP